MITSQKPYDSSRKQNRRTTLIGKDWFPITFKVDFANKRRQIVTNHFLHFLALDRSDPKKFQILQLIAALLCWTDEQKEQAGLARPGTSNNSLRLPMSPFHRTPSTPSLSTEFFNESPATKESLAELWTGFLERSAEEGSVAGSRSGSISSSARPDTRGGDGGGGGR